MLGQKRTHEEMTLGLQYSDQLEYYYDIINYKYFTYMLF